MREKHRKDGKAAHRRVRGMLPLAAALVLAFAGGGVVMAPERAVACEECKGKYKIGDEKTGIKRSGYLYSTPETQAMQDDDFDNPGMIWVERGRELWTQVDGKAGKSCASCHDKPEKLRGVYPVYPKLDEKTGKLINIEQRINKCRTEQMQAKPWKWESEELLSMTTLVGYVSRGMPVNVKVDGAYQPFFEKGKAFYYQRRGQLDMACKHCHIDNPGKMIRADLLSEGRAGGAFPLYRLKWQKLGSLHRRFRGCNKQVRAVPYKAGSDEYVNLELYIKWRSNGLPVEVPAVRR